MGIQHPSFHQQQEGYNYGNSNKIGIEQSNKGYKCITVNKISHRYTTGNIIEGILEHSCFFSLIEKTRVFLRSKKGIPWYNQMFMDFVELQMGISGDIPKQIEYIYIYRNKTGKQWEYNMTYRQFLGPQAINGSTTIQGLEGVSYWREEITPKWDSSTPKATNICGFAVVLQCLQLP